MFDYSDLMTYVLLLLKKMDVPPEDQTVEMRDLIRKTNTSQNVPVRLASDLSGKDPFCTVLAETRLGAIVSDFGSGIHRVSVIDSTGKVIGLLSQSLALDYLMRHLSEFPKLQPVMQQTIEELGLARNKVLSVNGKAKVLDALVSMSKNSVSSLAILDDQGVLLGNISMTDIQHVMRDLKTSWLWLSCFQFVAKIRQEQGVERGEDQYPVMDVTASSTFGYALSKLQATRVHRLWVANEMGLVVGVVSLTDVFKVLTAHLDSLLSTVSASITCALPAGGTYKAGDSIILDWGSDGTAPVVTDIRAINGTLYCNGNNAQIASVTIPNFTGPYNWTVPGVGNATSIGGSIGSCPLNAFHIEYMGSAAGFLGISLIPWGPIRCGTITILPAPNGTLTTTTTAMPSTTMSATSSETATPTNSSNDTSNSGLSTTVIAVIAAVLAIIVTLSIVAVVVCVRRRRRRRNLNNALKPWSSSNPTRFTEVSSMDDTSYRHSGSNAMTSIAATGAGVIAAAGAGVDVESSYELKPQPTLPQTDELSYYPDDGDYGASGFQQQQQQLLQHNHHGYNQQGYGGYNDNDSYYNPYYASGAGLGLGATAVATVEGGIMNQSNPSFYNVGQTTTPGGQIQSTYAHDRFQGNDLSQQPLYGYLPPPPQLNPSPSSSTQSYARAGLTNVESSQPSGTGSTLTSLPLVDSASSSPKRAPQTTSVMQEMGRREAEMADGQDDITVSSPR
ncbi:cell separation during budding [Dissophora globulifera]|uniref:Cell separation during budding n=1 Tax=Dissophora globulifera TaxID=979702 RepID=A0A9P6UYA1_9FUNG|nr:cell separation during budding [Dissophora globulifera]